MTDEKARLHAITAFLLGGTVAGLLDLSQMNAIDRADLRALATGGPAPDLQRALKRFGSKTPPGLKEKLQDFYSAALALSAELEKGQDVSSGYPFKNSFEEITDKIGRWVEIQTQLEHLIQPSSSRT